MKNPQRIAPDQPLFDATPYRYGRDDSISISYATENAAITQHKLTIKKTTIAYTARTGHLVTTDPDSPEPAAKIFYVSFTANGAKPSKRRRVGPEHQEAIARTKISAHFLLA